MQLLERWWMVSYILVHYVREWASKRKALFLWNMPSWSVRCTPYPQGVGAELSLSNFQQQSGLSTGNMLQCNSWASSFAYNLREKELSWVDEQAIQCMAHNASAMRRQKTPKAVLSFWHIKQQRAAHRVHQDLLAQALSSGTSRLILGRSPVVFWHMGVLLLHRFICDCVSALVPFFQLWPENLQLALSRVLSTEVLVRQESVLARGTPCTRVVFVLSGKVGAVCCTWCMYVCMYICMYVCMYVACMYDIYCTVPLWLMSVHVFL